MKPEDRRKRDQRRESSLADQSILAMGSPRFCHVCLEHKDREEFSECGKCWDCLDDTTGVITMSEEDTLRNNAVASYNQSWDDAIKQKRQEEANHIVTTEPMGDTDPLLSEARDYVHNWDTSQDLEDFINSHIGEIENLVSLVIESVREDIERNAHDANKVVMTEEPDIGTLILAGDMREDCPNDDPLSAARMRHIYGIIYKAALLKSKG